ncbi:MAG UNVERIFIED_CONTAM: hemagglutinin repeat-containing protein [Planctomycetaceae bacterium]
MEISAGQQIVLNASLQAAADIQLQPGIAGSDDVEGNIVLNTRSSLNVAGLGLNGAGSLIRLESDRDLVIPANIVAGGTIRQTFGPIGELLSETYEWSNRESRIEVVAAGRVQIGADTTDAQGLPVKKGVFLRASHGVSITGGPHASGTGVVIYPGGGVSASAATGNVSITTPEDAEIYGNVVAGGDILLVQNAAGNTVGYTVTTPHGASSVLIDAGRQLRVGQTIAAGKFITLSAGVDPVDAQNPYSGTGLVLQGTATLKTTQPDARVLLQSDAGVQILASPASAEDVFAIHAPGVGSTVTIEVPQSASVVPQPRMYLANRILAHSALSITGGDSSASAAKLELDYGSAIELLTGSLTLQDTGDLEVRSDLFAWSGDVTVSTTGALTLRSRIRAGGNAVLAANGGDLTLPAGSRIDAGGMLQLSASGDVSIATAVGDRQAPQDLQILAANRSDQRRAGNGSADWFSRGAALCGGH